MSIILQVVIFVSDDEYFDYINYSDYLPPIGVDLERLKPYTRLKVPFGKDNKKKIGLLIAIKQETSVSPEKLKAALEILDSSPLFSPDHFALIQWASQYYHYNINKTISAILPPSIKKENSIVNQSIIKWKITDSHINLPIEDLPGITPLQLNILRLLKEYPQGLSKKTIISQFSTAQRTLTVLQIKGWIIPIGRDLPDKPIIINPCLQLNAAQQTVVTQVCQRLTQFYPCLLDGITGSGKTEVYLQIIQQVLLQGKQALVLVPEINLTPQMLERFQQRFIDDIVVLHSKIDKPERLQAWLAARDGQARVIIGTRSAVWTPLQNPGIFIVDEEHDLSYKQQDHFRYSARDIALVRAQRAKVPIILGSATPSLDSLYHAHQGRYQHFILPERAGTAVHPTFHLVNMRQQPARQHLSQQLLSEIETCLAKKQQILLFINRRGYAPTLICFNCGWVAQCIQCDSNLTYHDAKQQLLCHHCGYHVRIYTQCPHCHHPKLHLMGQGTERIEDELKQYFPQARVLRIDSDSTQKRRSMESILAQIHQGNVDILVGTQMLAKGHHFPNVTLVGILNADSGLFNIDFRASEHMAQLLIQVAGRAGRTELPGKVVVQTYFPQHPLLESLIKQNYAAFAQRALEERQQINFPPFARLALLRAKAKNMENAMQFLYKAKLSAQQLDTTDIQLWGPVQAPMEKRAGWYRAQLLLQSNQRNKLHLFLTHWLPQLKTSKNIYWSLDIDPQSLL